MFGLVETGSLEAVTAQKSSQQSRLCIQHEEPEYAKHIIFCCFKTAGWGANLECRKLLMFHDESMVK